MQRKEELSLVFCKHLVEQTDSFLNERMADLLNTSAAHGFLHAVTLCDIYADDVPALQLGLQCLEAPLKLVHLFDQKLLTIPGFRKLAGIIANRNPG